MTADSRTYCKIVRLIEKSNSSEKNKALMLDWLGEMAVMSGIGRKYPASNKKK